MCFFPNSFKHNVSESKSTDKVIVNPFGTNSISPSKNPSLIEYILDF